MKLGDPDVYVQWTRCETPGSNPTWESQCGVVEQTGFGDTPVFRGYVKNTRRADHFRTTFSSIKKIIEKEYQQAHPLEWAYNDNDEY